MATRTECRKIRIRPRVEEGEEIAAEQIETVIKEAAKNALRRTEALVLTRFDIDYADSDAEVARI